MKNFFKRFKGIIAVGMIAALLSTSAYGLEFSDTDEFSNNRPDYLQDDKHGGTLCYDVATGEVTYTPGSETEAYSNETEGFSPGYDPFAYEGEFEGVSTLGFRDRYHISNPANDSSCRNTVHIEAKTQSGGDVFGTGFMIGPNAVATCGHLLCDNGYGANGKDWAWIKSAKVTPAMNTGTTPAPYGTAAGTKFICGYDWAKDLKRYDDWGIIVLDSNIGNKVGWLGLRYQSDTYNKTEMMVNGYPYLFDYSKNKYSTENLYKSYGYITSTESNLLYSSNTLVTYADSGGPCYIDSSDTGYTAIGITVAHTEDNNENYLEAVFRRIDKSLFDILVEYRTSTL